MKVFSSIIVMLFSVTAFSQIVSPNGNNLFYYNGLADVTFRFSERGNGGRAFVHGPGNVFAINYEEDFNGGTRIGRDVFFKDAGNSYILSGNFGIGTISPISKLDVLGDIRSYNASFGQMNSNTSAKNYANFGTNNHGSVLISSNLYFSSNDVLKVVNTHPSMSGGAILLPGNSQPNQGKILFYTTDPRPVVGDEMYSGSIAMEIRGNGNVGIGVTDSKNKLDVNGTIHSKEVKVDMEGWSDFVFKKEYNLPTLEEVEKHIAEKGHLKYIPSEKEVLQNGINLGEMNAKLLQKIEELTLYMIEQNKQIMNLKNRLEKVESNSK